MLSLQQVTYMHPNKDVLFSNIQFNIGAHQKLALIGNNGAGKSTLLRIMAGQLVPTEGNMVADSRSYYMPQVFGQFNHLSVAAALQIESKLKALQEILAGQVTEANLTILDDDWTIEERAREALAHWGLAGLEFDQSLASLSGGQKTKVFLAGIAIHQPEIILLDEPSNHLDMQSRQQLYELIKNSRSTMVVVSHDRTLLNLLDTVAELSKRGITQYGGNYDFYLEQKELEAGALAQDVKSKEKALRKAKEVERESIERQQKLDARGKKKQEKAGLPTISMNTLRNNAEKSTARIKSVHEEKTGNISQELNELRKELPDKDKMRIGFDHSGLHKGKILAEAKNVNLQYHTKPLWPEPLNFQINSGERIVITGANGSGKTSLVKLILGQLEPASGTIYRAMNKALYVDQDYSLIDDRLNVFEQAEKFNQSGLQEHEIKIRLTRFLFTQEYWDKPCATLSGGEKMRLMLCCLTISGEAPDLIVLDEPTNNLDIQNIAILTTAINEYEGTLLVVSHDAYFLKEINVERKIAL
ncbi:ribosomal protection-like ABC-F family protein [Pseudoflavitalea rhizosphaerae]|uniref:ribosomal protection-like ABC-F family protein n=1 Tax=Pseudoflavitalea rhizosphaerae TaxID=1884793 RepID=UPI000F8DEB2A|nr:ABC-F family ATP-binding cassette domain-containing protein [Pseudoflavitalea rhizosphaerae]